MKLLLIYLEEEKNKHEAFFSLLEKMGIPLENLQVKSPEETRRDVEKQFTSFFLLPAAEEPLSESPTHVAIFSLLASGWVDFLAGFACGSHIPLLVCGNEARKCIPEAFNFCFKFFDDLISLRSFFEVEYDFHKKMEAVKGANAARETLLRMGVPVNSESMVRSVGEGSVEELMFFLAAGFSPDTRSKTGVPLLCIAARNGNREIVRLLYAADATVNSRADDRETTALFDSVLIKHHELAGDLIRAGADLNVQSKDGQTALIVAVGAGDAEMVEILLKAGADPDIVDSMGVSARKYAELFKKAAIIDLFETHPSAKTA